MKDWWKEKREELIKYLKAQDYPEQWLRQQPTAYLTTLYNRIEKAYQEINK